MGKKDILALPIADIADKDCTLFLWSTPPTLDQGIETLKAWGFSYVTIAFHWIKQNTKSDSLFMGCGFWTRANAEIVLLGKKGKPRRENASVHSVVMSPRGEHSEKPDEIRKRIVALMGEGVPRIELFARGDDASLNGWDVWGDQAVNQFSILEDGKNGAKSEN